MYQVSNVDCIQRPRGVADLDHLGLSEWLWNVCTLMELLNGALPRMCSLIFSDM
jgi:hypothetical protein